MHIRRSKMPSLQLLVLILTPVEGLTHFAQLYQDSPGYIKTAYSFLGTSPPVPWRLLRPVIPFAASLLNSFLDIRTSFGIVNVFLWSVTSLLMFRYARRLTGQEDTAFLAAAFFTTSVPMLIFGAAILTDMAGYLFVLVGVILLFNWNLLRASLRKVVVAGLIMTLGVLARETVASVFFVAVLWALMSKGSWRRLLLFVAIPLGLALIWSGLIGVSYYNWAMSNATFAAEHQAMSIPMRILTWSYSIAHAFRPEIVILAIVGFLRLRDRTKAKQELTIALGLSIFLLIAPGVIDYRYTFILFPAMLPLAALGTREIATWLTHALPISDSTKLKISVAFEVAVLLLYLVETNLITIRFVSLPWKPYVDPTLPTNAIP